MDLTSEDYESRNEYVVFILLVLIVMGLGFLISVGLSIGDERYSTSITVREKSVDSGYLVIVTCDDIYYCDTSRIYATLEVNKTYEIIVREPLVERLWHLKRIEAIRFETDEPTVCNYTVPRSPGEYHTTAGDNL